MDIEEVSAAAGAPYSFPALSSAEQPAPTVLSPTPSRRLDEDVGGDAEEGNGLARKRVRAREAGEGGQGYCRYNLPRIALLTLESTGLLACGDQV